MIRQQSARLASFADVPNWGDFAITPLAYGPTVILMY